MWFYLRQLIEAVEYLYHQGVTHRNIKAENVLLDDNFELKLGDFGFAAPINGKDGLGYLHSYKGTGRYMASEMHASSSYTGS
jgi:serine/threonine protein kinase